MIILLPYGDSDLCPVRSFKGWLAAAAIGAGPIFRHIWLLSHLDLALPPSPAPHWHCGPYRPERRSHRPARAVAADFGRPELGGHSLKRGARTTGLDRGVYPAKLKRLERHKRIDVLGE